MAAKKKKLIRYTRKGLHCSDVTLMLKLWSALAFKKSNKPLSLTYPRKRINYLWHVLNSTLGKT